jgi:hypothetical protein
VKILEVHNRKETCKSCLTVVELEGPQDIFYATFGAAYYAGDSGETKYFWVCPSCGEDNFPKNISDSWKEDAKAWRRKSPSSGER